MTRTLTVQKISLNDPDAIFWDQALEWGSRFNHCMFFNGNGVKYPMGAFPRMIMAGRRREISFIEGNAFSAMRSDRDQHRSWLCGYFGYDLKNEIEKLQSSNQDFTQFPEMCFFEPEHVLIFGTDEISIYSEWPASRIIEDISASEAQHNSKKEGNASLMSSVSRNQYINTVEKIREHILNGDIYEMNYCIDFVFEEAYLEPLQLFRALTLQSPTPFSCFGRFGDHYLICASPERFLRRNGDELLSQPIKGTAQRSDKPEADARSKSALFNSEKERAENMMIVDLVRNDLAKSAITGSVKVPELFGIYSFRHLHQMISSVTARIKTGVHAVDTIKNAFPMGSMTGAPKVKVMELIEHYESARRSIYSGAAGFFTPDEDFDFNVVIRSLTYNSKTRHLSFSVGSAITFDSDPEQEYEECLLKARAILEVLSQYGIRLPDPSE